MWPFPRRISTAAHALYVMPSQGLKGHLVASSPDLFGCQPIVINTTSSLATFVLIERSPAGSAPGDGQVCCGSVVDWFVLLHGCLRMLVLRCNWFSRRRNMLVDDCPPFSTAPSSRRSATHRRQGHRWR